MCLFCVGSKTKEPLRKAMPSNLPERPALRGIEVKVPLLAVL